MTTEPKTFECDGLATIKKSEDLYWYFCRSDKHDCHVGVVPVEAMVNSIGVCGYFTKSYTQEGYQALQELRPEPPKE